MSTNHLDLDAAEGAAIRLMSLLKDKKAPPLNAYKDLMEWHIREKGEIRGCQTINEDLNRK